MIKVLLIHSITHNGLEYLPGLHDVDDGLAAHWRQNAPHVLSPIPVSQPGQVQRAPDFKEEEVGSASGSDSPLPEGTRSGRKKRR